MSIFEGNRALLTAFRQGDRQALSAVYAFYVDDVATLIRRGFSLDVSQVSVPGVRDPALQLDLLQDVFVRAFAPSARQAYDGLSPFRPWLLRMAKNLIIDSARRRGTLNDLKERLDAEAEHQVLAVAPEEELQWNTLREATKSFTATLPAEQQRFVKLRFDECRSQADVAQALNVTRRFVRTTEQTIREGLRAYLKQRGLP